jgi:hypothetical protein
MIQDIRLVFAKEIDGNPNAGGEYDPERNIISLRRGLSKKQVKEMLLHEMQHAIQQREEFNQGSSPEAAAVFIFNSAYANIKDTDAFKKLKTPQERMYMIVNYAEKRGEKSLGQQAFRVYFRNYGETEARYVAKRMEMNEEELRKTPIFNDGYVYSVNKIASQFVDNLREIGYNQKQIDEYFEKGLLNETYNQSNDDSRSADQRRSWGRSKGNKGPAGSQNVERRTNERIGVYRAGDIQGRKASDTDGNLRQDLLKYSVSEEVAMDDGAVGYEELKRQVAEQKEQIQRLHKDDKSRYSVKNALPLCSRAFFLYFIVFGSRCRTLGCVPIPRGIAPRA